MTDTLVIECPSCKRKLQWDSNNPYRPFCSQSCKDKDFVAWANEENVIGGNSVYDDLLSGDLPPQE
ncbi:DNA gyrase inhibitor YacG [Dasania sp. GY-MA-18]|uniref:DNA gyrase inhibitor YacG n=1 Tax=Dasania phycosphaerae TaxID=2950436 RepID=A0A9J6RPS1_9GAMM|nr:MULTISPECIES: DNA gyrase inhibitor YacG [Dasania]MCR8923677.1 DNA gyrase inhibitor YacG [Dasania sp. GY-MA-18]MCZ0866111.1 DNA gyrase inhibitor YacG [Dasania phycosphaerae]MCZ0869835.1 DNA gyrase inhibitor YacG [Dasania phycosphaerae]